MPTIEFESTVNAPAGEILAWHSRPGAFDRLAPPWMRLEVLERHGDISSGSRLTFRVGKGLFSVKWEALHSRNREGLGFTDVQVHGPFAAWRHEHRFTPVSLETCLIRDRVRYQLPLGWVGRAVAGTQVRHRLERLFAWRHRRLKDDLERHHHFEDRPRLKIAVTGSSGLIGSQLCAFLTTGGHSVYPLVRRQADPESLEIEWDPREGRIQTEKLEGMDAAIHLAGENIAGIWTKSKREKILQSRTEGTRLLAETLAGLERKPRVLISASALGWYGDHGDRKIHVGANVGSGFLARVCREWEAAADPAREAGIRVVHPRIGMVLSAQGGALAMMLPVFKPGLGGRLGSGEQYESWIALDDLVGAIYHALSTEEMEGPFNACAPAAVTNREFAKTLGRVLHRPAILPVPGFVLKKILGDMARELLLASTRVVPDRLEETGFGFLCPDIETALRHELGVFRRGKA